MAARPRSDGKVPTRTLNVHEDAHKALVSYVVAAHGGLHGHLLDHATAAINEYVQRHREPAPNGRSNGLLHQETTTP